MPLLAIRFLVFAALFSASKLFAAESLNLKQTIGMALSNATPVKQSNINLDLAKYAQDDADASYYPKLVANVAAGATGQNPSADGTESPARTSHAGIQLSQSILDDGARSLKSKTASISEQKAKLVSTDDRNKLILDVTTTFIDLSIAAVELSAKEESLKELTLQASESLMAMRQGIKPKRDHQRVETELERQRLAVTVAEDRLTNVRSRLCALVSPQTGGVGCQPFVPLTAAESLGFDNTKISKIDNDKSLLAERLALEAQTLSLQTEFERNHVYWPSLSLDAVAGYGTDHFWGPGKTQFYDTLNTTWSVQLSVNYTLWDAGTARRKVATASLTEQLKALEREQALTQRSTMVLELERTLKQAANNLALSTKILRMDKDTYDTSVTDYRQGRIGYFELNDVREKLLQSRVGVAQSYFTALQKLWEHSFYSGEIYEAYEKI